jgi:catalase
MSYDFLSNSPETTHNAMFLYSDRGTSDGYRHMDGFGTHTFKWVNSEGEQFWIKIHIKTDSGIKNMTAEKAIEIRGSDPDYHTRDLYNHLASG